MPNLTQEEIQKLKALALAAETKIIRSHGWAGTVDMFDAMRVDEAYLLAASPATILSLIAQLEARPAVDDAPTGKLTKSEARKILDLALELEKTGRIVSLSEGQERADYVARNRNIQCALTDALNILIEPCAPPSPAVEAVSEQSPQGCSKCGISGIHACPGAPIEPWTTEKIEEFSRVLAEYETEPPPAIQAVSEVPLPKGQPVFGINGNTTVYSESELRAYGDARERAALASTRAQGGDGWQPIETAPKDGREVLLFLGAPWNEVEKARWYKPWANWQAVEIPQDPVREEYCGIGSALPTHWMPLPIPPNRATPATKEPTP